MVPKLNIIKQQSSLTYECAKEVRDGVYFHRLVLTDDEGYKYKFRSEYTFKNDESGKAHFSLDHVQTADFDYSVLKEMQDGA